MCKYFLSTTCLDCAPWRSLLVGLTTGPRFTQRRIKGRVFRTSKSAPNISERPSDSAVAESLLFREAKFPSRQLASFLVCWKALWTARHRAVVALHQFVNDFGASLARRRGLGSGTNYYQGILATNAIQAMQLMLFVRGWISMTLKKLKQTIVSKPLSFVGPSQPQKTQQRREQAAPPCTNLPNSRHHKRCAVRGAPGH